MDESVFTRNNASLQGGAIYVQGSSRVDIEDAYFSENESGFLGGGAISAEVCFNLFFVMSMKNRVLNRSQSLKACICQSMIQYSKTMLLRAESDLEELFACMDLVFIVLLAVELALFRTELSWMEEQSMCLLDLK